jgi:hypothetical protein
VANCSSPLGNVLEAIKPSHRCLRRITAQAS